ncbi:hypothetical protein AAE478_000851 [Parahypoxylon ruwenzoriense]
MDKTNASSTPSTRTKTPKKRNSDVRKEQNRIASRAYREKRKQKLALLDEILKSDSQTDSMSSVSDEAEGYAGSWTFSQSRHASNSPVPAVLSTVPVTTAWPAPSESMTPGVQGYTQDVYDGWIDCFDRPNNAFPTSNDYVQQFISPGVAGHSLEASAPYNMQSMPSITSASSPPHVPLDPMLVSGHLTPHHHHTHPVPNQSIPDSSSLPVYGDDEVQKELWVASLKEDALTALERFAGYSHVQQQQILGLIQKRRGLPQNAPNDQGLEFGYPTCQATPPPSAVDEEAYTRSFDEKSPEMGFYESRYA